jgi:GT2 family glycosyltransferase
LKTLLSEITIILVLYKSKSNIFKCLKFLDNFNKIIIDNSNDDLLKNRIEKKHKNINKYILSKNIGYSKAVNKCFFYVNSKYILILSPDCFIDSKNIKILLNTFKNYKNVGLVSPSLHNNNNPVPNYSFFPEKRFIKTNKIQKHTFKLLSKNNIIEGDCCADWVWGTCSLIRSSVFRKVRLLEEQFWLYWSDVHLCYKLKKLNLSIIQSNKAKAIHLGGKSSNYSFLDFVYSTIDHKKSEFIYYKIINYNYLKIFIFQFFDFFQRFIFNFLRLNFKKSLINFLRVIALITFFFKINIK